eukprot:203775_1
MFKLLSLCGLLALSQSKEEVALDVMLVDYDGMYSNECAGTSTSSTSAPSSTAYEHGWEKWSQGQYGGSESAASPGSVKGNEISSGDESADETSQSKVFCDCLAEEKKNGKSYADSQNAFSKCIDKANGNDASHWKKVSARYAHKYGVKVEKGTTAASAETNDNSAETVHEPSNESEAKPDEALMVAVPSADNHAFGKTAVFVTLIGASVLLLICGWFIKGSLKTWRHGKEYDHIKINNAVHSYQSEDNGTNKNYHGCNQYSAV